MNSKEENETYRESNWKFDPEVDLDYDNKFFQISLGSRFDADKCENLFRTPLKVLLEKEDMGTVLSGFPNILEIGILMEDSSKQGLMFLLDSLIKIRIPENVIIKQYKNYKNFREISFLDFKKEVENLL
jgi:hypothetical protein